MIILADDAQSGLLFLLLLAFCKNHFLPAEVTFTVLCDAGLPGSLSTTNSAFWHCASPPFFEGFCRRLHAQLLLQSRGNLPTQFLGLLPSISLIFHLGELLRRNFSILAKYPGKCTHWA